MEREKNLSFRHLLFDPWAIGTMLIYATASISTIVLSWLGGAATDGLLQNEAPASGTRLILSLLCIVWLFGIMKTVLWQKCEYEMYRKLYQRLERKLLRLLQKETDQYISGQLGTLFINDVNNIVKAFQEFMSRFFPGMAGMIMALVLLLFIHWSLPIAALIFSVIPVFVIRKFGSAMQNAHKQYRDRLTEMNQTISEHLSCIETVKAYRMELVCQKQEDETLDKLQKACHRTNLAVAQYSLPITASAFVSITGLMILSGILCIHGMVSVGSLMVVAMITDSIVSPMMSINRMQSYYKKAKVSTDKLKAFLSGEEEKESGRMISGTISQIQTENVSFSYDENHRVFERLSLRFRPGKPYFILGANGSGKSTLLKLLLGIYAPAGGMISMQGVPLEDWSISEIRGHCKVSCQEPVTFEGSILDNFGNLSKNQVLKLCGELGLIDEIGHLKDGFHTILNWEGKPLSLGQRQRLQLIRTLAGKADIYLLDEPTSALNKGWAEKLNVQIHTLAQQHIVIVVTHNPELIQSGDHTIFLEKGACVHEA